MNDWIEINKEEISCEIEKCSISQLSELLFAVRIHELEKKRNYGVIDSKAFPEARRKLIENEFYNSKITVEEFENIKDFDVDNIDNIDNYRLLIYTFEIRASSIDHLIAIFKDRFETVDRRINKAVTEISTALDRNTKSLLDEIE